MKCYFDTLMYDAILYVSGDNIAQQNKLLSIKTIIKEPNINYKCIYA